MFHYSKIVIPVFLVCECGKPKSSASRISGGVPGEIKHFPWMVYLNIKVKMCEGLIIK